MSNLCEPARIVSISPIKAKEIESMTLKPHFFAEASLYSQVSPICKRLMGLME
jgi:hypothetical protein